MNTRIAFSALLVTLAACTTPTPVEEAAKAGVVDVPALVPHGQLDFRLASGTYTCDMGQRVDVMRAAGAEYDLEIGWTGRRYRLVRNPSSSGLPRYEDAASGLVWIDLPWKGMLLDGHANRPLASDCIAS